MEYRNDKIAFIIDNVDIVETISTFLSLQKKGNNYWGVCPFHEDNKPSMSVSPEKKIFNCFSCNVGGNVLTFLMKKNNWNIAQALEYLNNTNNLNIDLNEYKKNQKEYTEQEKLILNANYDAFIFYSLFLEMSQNLLVKNFLSQRFLTKEIIQEFGIGYAPEEGIIKKLLKKNHDLAILINASLATEKEQDFFKNRIIFSIKNEEGKIVGFSARTLEKETSFAKYINSAENSLFKKSQILYNYHNAINFLDKNKTLYVCEGFMDVIALYRANIKNAIAIMGTALTKEHAKLLKNKRIVLLLDGDKAGINATKKSILTLLENKIDTFVINNSTNLDPDEFLNQYGEEALKNLLKEKEISAMDFIYKQLNVNLDVQNFNSVQNFKNLIWEYLKFLNYEEKQYYINKIQKDFNINFQNYNNENNYIERPKTEIIFQKDNLRKISIFEILQKRILNSLLNNSSFVKIIIKKQFEFNNLNFIKVFNWILESRQSNEVLPINEKLIETLNEINKEENIAKTEEDFLDLVNFAIETNIKEKNKKVVKYIEKHNINHDESAKIISDLIKQNAKNAKEKEKRRK